MSTVRQLLQDNVLMLSLLLQLLLMQAQLDNSTDRQLGKEMFILIRQPSAITQTKKKTEISPDMERCRYMYLHLQLHSICICICTWHYLLSLHARKTLPRDFGLVACVASAVYGLDV